MLLVNIISVEISLVIPLAESRRRCSMSATTFKSFWWNLQLISSHTTSKVSTYFCWYNSAGVDGWCKGAPLPRNLALSWQDRFIRKILWSSNNSFIFKGTICLLPLQELFSYQCILLLEQGIEECKTVALLIWKLSCRVSAKERAEKMELGLDKLCWRNFENNR